MDSSNDSAIDMTDSSTEDQVEMIRLKLRATCEENNGLKSYIDDMNKECMELNVKLFEEANAMVVNALADKDVAVKRSEELKRENDLYRNEVALLKKIIKENEKKNYLQPEYQEMPTSSPVSTFTPFINSAKQFFASGSTGNKMHRRTTSTVNLSTNTYFKPESVEKPVDNLNLYSAPVYKDFLEWLDSSYKKSQHAWMCIQPSDTGFSSNTIHYQNSFIQNLVTEDVLPCLNFTDKQMNYEAYRLRQELLGCIAQADFGVILAVLRQVDERRCLFTSISPCTHSFMLKNQDSEPVPISGNAHNRILAVVDLYKYLHTLVSPGKDILPSPQKQFFHIQTLRSKLARARLGLDL